MLIPVETGSARQAEQGTILIVVVAVIMLVSAILVLGVGGFHMTDNQDRDLQTGKRQEFLIRELAAYVQRTNTLPCLRASFRTIGDEVLKFRVDLLEHQIAHEVKDPNGRAYNRTAFLPERKRMMQRWSDYLDRLKSGEGREVVEMQKRG